MSHCQNSVKKTTSLTQKSPRRTSYWSSTETIAQNYLVLGKILASDDKQTKERTIDSIDA